MTHMYKYDTFKTDVWSKKWLMDEFQEKMVEVLMNQAWAIDELMAGVDVSDIEDVIWEDYENWANDYLLKMKEEIILNNE